MNWDKLTSQLDIALDKCRDLLHERKITTWEKVTEKDCREVVTSMDLEIEALLTTSINDIFPQATILAEESYKDSAPLEADLCFIIDPIDGTKEFLSGRSSYAISIAVLENQRLIAGVLDFPARTQRLWAIHGQGAVINGHHMEVSQEARLDKLRIMVSPSQYRDPSFSAIWASLEGATLIPMGAVTPKVTAIALGEADAALYFPGDNSIAAVWDFAAAGLILAEAGGLFTSLDGQDLMKTLPIFHKKGWIATNQKCHDVVLHALLPQIVY